MKELHATIKLVDQTFLFGEKINLMRGQETVVDLNKLNIADLEILAHHIAHASIVSNISADEFANRAAKLRGDVQEGKVEEVFKLQSETEVRVLDAEVTTEDGEKVTLKELEEKKEAVDERRDFIVKEIINAPSSVALLKIRELKDADEELLNFALSSEKATKSRKSIITHLENELKALQEASK